MIPGTLLAGKYRVERLLGEGAMGVVLAARHTDLDELRAIKLMLPAALGDALGVERFLREARAAARLRSKHICKVLDVGRLDDGAPFLVMEYLEGVDLRAVLERPGALPVAEVVRYLRQACEGLAEAHAQGIVHRDIKPANLFLATEPNGAPCIKVLDFGIAKMIAPPGSAKALEMTSTTAVIGTPMFMSPEQMRSTRDVDARTDIWALGVILYRALTGKAPFHGSTITQLCAAIVADAPAPLASLRSGLPPGLEAVVLRCLEKDPRSRYASAAELGAALEPFATARATSAMATTTALAWSGIVFAVALAAVGLVAGLMKGNDAAGAPAATSQVEAVIPPPELPRAIVSAPAVSTPLPAESATATALVSANAPIPKAPIVERKGAPPAPGAPPRKPRDTFDTRQ